MKTQTLAIHTVLLALMATMGVACGSSGGGMSLNNASATNASTTSTTTTTTTGTNITTTNAGVALLGAYGGAATAFTPDSVQTVANYEEVHALTAPTNYAVSVNLSNQGGGQYGGTVMFTYQDQGNWYTGQFVTGNSTVSVSGNGWYNGMNAAAFNQWMTYSGKSAFHGFFQDGLGAVILVLDNSNAGSGLGDGLAATTYNGSLWFKNFVNPAGALQSALMCWFIEIGPFDCQAFLGSNGQVSTTSALYPSNGYTRLGTFSGLNTKQAFNQ